MEKKKKKKGRKNRKLIAKFDVFPLRLEIRADVYNYILYVFNIKESEDNGCAHIWFYGTLDGLFEDLFEYLTKVRLATGKNKSMEKIVEIIEKTRKEILGIMEPFSEFKKE